MSRGISTSLYNKFNYLFIITFVLLLIANFKMSYNYYQFLKISVVLTCIYGIYANFKESKSFIWALVFAITLGVFNPLLQLHFNKETWHLIDVSIALVFLVYFTKNAIVKIFKKHTSNAIMLSIFLAVIPIIYFENKNQESLEQEYIKLINESCPIQENNKCVYSFEDFINDYYPEKLIDSRLY